MERRPWNLGLIAAVVGGAPAGALAQPEGAPGAPRIEDTSPAPELSPVEVVKIQLDALRSNPVSRDDAGIRVAFRFASPENRAQTGPVDRFIRMVKGPAYAPLLGFSTSEAKVLSRDAERTEIAVVVEGHRGSVAGFVWVLGQQRGGEYDGCWMTDAVIRVDLDEVSPANEPAGDDGPIEI